MAFSWESHPSDWPHDTLTPSLHICRCLGKPVKVHVFDEDTHALDKPLTGYDQWLHIVSFFNTHTLKA